MDRKDITKIFLSIRKNVTKCYNYYFSSTKTRFSSEKNIILALQV